MRIAHVLRKLDPDAWGGTEMAMQRLFEGLRSQGVTPVAYCPRLEHEVTGDPLVAAGFEVHRFKAFVPVFGLSEQRRRQLVAVGGNLMSFDLPASLLRQEDISVVHAHALGRLGAISRAVATQRRLPFVITIHGGLLDLPPKVKQAFNAPISGGWEWGKLFGLLFQSHRLFHDVDAVLTCNPREAELLREKYPHKRIVVQPHGVEFSAYDRDYRADASKAFPQIEGRQVLLSLGRIDPIKNQAWLLNQAADVFSRFPNALLVLAGACTDEPYGELVDRQIRELNLQDRVLLTGGLPPNDPRLLGLLQTAEVLLLPSVSETFGLVILEAWAAGTTVISSRTSGASALIAHGHNGWLFDLDRPETFHQALAHTLHQPGLAAEMARRGAEKARAGFSAEAVASQMKTLYEQVIEEKQCVT